jgi:hypothetical protein
MTDVMMAADDLEVETHFVENPFIKTRERANKKLIDARNAMSADQIRKDAEEMDIV